MCMAWNIKKIDKDEILTEKQILENIEVVKKGNNFYKYGNDDKPHKRFFQLTNDSKEIIWYDESSFKLFRKIKRLPLKLISNIYIGINSSKLFENFNIPLSSDQECMSISCENNNELALQSDNEATIKAWYYALNYLINHNKISNKGQQILKEEERKYYDSELDMKTSQLWRNVALRLSPSFPEVELSFMYVDNASMQLIHNPCQFDVIVTSNMFGDILSDEASQLTGSIGMLPSSALGSGDKPFLYEPIHGSAPDIAGKNIANPKSMIEIMTFLVVFEILFLSLKTRNTVTPNTKSKVALLEPVIKVIIPSNTNGK